MLMRAFADGQGVEAPELLAEEFVFMGPFVGGAGGLPKADYLKAVGGFNIKKAFPDLNPRFHHFRADPLDAGRIWLLVRGDRTRGVQPVALRRAADVADSIFSRAALASDRRHGAP